MKTLEERIVSELQAERGLVPTAQPGPTPEAAARWPRYLAVAAALVVMIAGVGWVVERLDRDPNLHLVEIGGATLAIDSTRPPYLATDVTVLYGAVGDEELLFEPPGVEQAIEQLDDPSLPSRARMLEAASPFVYVGETLDGSGFVYAPTPELRSDLIPPKPEGLLGRLRGWLFGDEWRVICHEVVGGINACGVSQDHDQITMISSLTNKDTWEIWWKGVPPLTSAVTVTVGGETRWQRPSALVAVFVINWPVEGPITLRALSSSGEVVAERTELDK